MRVDGVFTTDRHGGVARVITLHGVGRDGSIARHGGRLGGDAVFAAMLRCDGLRSRAGRYQISISWNFGNINTTQGAMTLESETYLSVAAL